jgi:hypothetical protein
VEEIASIQNDFFYCSSFTQMNDPMEGFFQASKILKGKSNYKDIVRKITNVKSKIGIACFSETYDNGLMWSHYAGNYSGICIAYSARDLLDGLPDETALVRLAYVDKPPVLFPSHAADKTNAVVRVLSHKQYIWTYEREWRVIGDVGPITYDRPHAIRRIFFGSRIKADHKAQILSAIEGTKIEVYMMEIEGWVHYWDEVSVKSKPRKFGRIR